MRSLPAVVETETVPANLPRGDFKFSISLKALLAIAYVAFVRTYIIVSLTHPCSYSAFCWLECGLALLVLSPMSSFCEIFYSGQKLCSHINMMCGRVMLGEIIR